MYKISLLVLWLVLFHSSYGQKKKIDTSSYKEWSRLVKGKISDDGMYVSYTSDYPKDIFNPNANRLNRDKLFISSVDGKFKEELPGGDGDFINNGKCFWYRRSMSDTVTIYWLGTSKKMSWSVKSIYVSDTGNKDFILFQLNENDQDIHYFNLNKNEIYTFKGVGSILQYQYLPNLNSMVLYSALKSGNSGGSLLYVDLLNRSVISIGKESYQNNGLSLIDSNKVVFISGNENSKHLYSFSFTSKELNEVKVDKNFISDISRLDKFSTKGELIVTKVVDLNKEKKDSDAENIVDLDLWSYSSSSVPPADKMNVSDIEMKSFSINLKNGLVDSYDPGNELDNVANRSEFDSILLTKNPEYSIDKKFLIYFLKNNYWSYEIATGVNRNLTSSISNNWISAENGDADVFFLNKGGIVAWVPEKNGVLISDEFDIWDISLDNKYLPSSITNQFGKVNKIKFFLLNARDLKDVNPIVTTKMNGIFVAFDTRTKKNGFFSKQTYFVRGNPKMIRMDDAMYWVPTVPMSFPNIIYSTFKPQKAKRSNIYLVAKSTAESSVNYYVTSNFKEFTQVSSNYPEKNFNWLTTELISWKSGEGQNLQGVLYKPENFDPSKKYPVIFYFYRKASANLNTYLYPLECPGCIIDIPTYVSNDYLVFTPDIYFIEGQTGKSALSAITSAVMKLSEKQFIDTSRLGVQGCSFSGFTTNYIITHSNLFKAACSASGLFDLVSGYNSINNGLVKQYQFEHGGPYQLGGTLWDKKETYIENSPIFSVDNLTTPLLIMHTTNDITIPLTNSIEFFLGAKRLQKKVWMLQYGNNNSHIVHGNEGRDFVLRMKQFFDYYLKGEDPPKWMTKGRSENFKGTDESISLDSTGKIP